ncbi:MarR family transcriptional regulator [Bradyrhizobium diazoefficiens]|nr:MarR family transcriptional regulator [Bradyrhizobium diazoefficiens]
MSATRKDVRRQHAIENLDITKHLTLEISSINRHLEEIRQLWGKTLGVSGPQWMILIAVSDFDQDAGVPVNVVSKLLHVDPSFVTTQSKILEQKDLLRRVPSPTDARVIRMSLTDKARKHLASLAEQFSAIRRFVFEEFDETELTAFTCKLITLNKRLGKMCLKVAAEFSFETAARTRGGANVATLSARTPPSVPRP